MKNTIAIGQPDNQINKWLLGNGFGKCRHNDYDCVLRLHDFHFLFWSDNLKHFSIGVVNEKKQPAGGYNKWNMVMIPKPIYTIEQAKTLINSIT